MNERFSLDGGYVGKLPAYRSVKIFLTTTNLSSGKNTRSSYFFLYLKLYKHAYSLNPKLTRKRKTPSKSCKKLFT